MTADLTERVQNADAAQRAGQDVTPRTRTVLDLIRDRKDMYGAVLNKSIDPERFVRVALASVGRNRQLMNCTQDSLLSALMLSAQLGLEPGSPLGHAYLVPFGKECTFIVGYKGYLELARRSGQIASIYAEPVFEGDEFTWTLGLDRDIVHRPLASERTNYETVTHVYAVAKLRDPDADPIFVVLNRDQIESYRKRSRAKDNGPWKTDAVAMALKTAVRRLSTWMPLSVEMAAAAALDERTVTRLDANLDFVDDLDTIDVEAIEQHEIPPPGASEGDDPASPEDASGPAEDPAADPMAQAHIDAMSEASVRTTREAVLDLLPDVKASPDWPKFLRKTGLSSNPQRWSDAQYEQVWEWITQPKAADA